MPITIILFLLSALVIIVTAVLLRKRKVLMYAVIACEVLMLIIAFAVFVYLIEHNTM